MSNVQTGDATSPTLKDARRINPVTKNLRGLESTGLIVGIGRENRRTLAVCAARCSERSPEMKPAGMVDSRANQTRQLSSLCAAFRSVSILFHSRKPDCVIGATVYRSRALLSDSVLIVC
jgi:hypothetical protein